MTTNQSLEGNVRHCNQDIANGDCSARDLRIQYVLASTWTFYQKNN
jgi:hypothetical protein